MELTENISPYIIEPGNTIEDAWGKIEVNHKRSLIVVENGKVVGAISDGDLRKAVLSKRLLTTPMKEVMNINFISLTEENKSKAEKIFIEKDIFLIPIVDKDLLLKEIFVRK